MFQLNTRKVLGNTHTTLKDKVNKSQFYQFILTGLSNSEI